MTDSHEQRTPVALTGLREDDPRLQPAARHPETVERVIAISFVLGLMLFLLFGYCFIVNAKAWTLGATLGGGLSLLGFGLVAWGKYLMPRGPFVEERHTLANTKADRDAFAAAIVERGGGVIKRRKMLGGLLGGGLGVFSVVALFPLLRSLGPMPKGTLFHTDWRKGSYAVDQTGRRIHQDDLTIGSIVTVFPEGTQDTDRGQAVDQTVIIRLSNEDFVTQKGRENWAPMGYVAYSKLCTHLGCPVGLYEQQLELLVCPCHQSMFDVTNGAIPNFGPAPRPLPQLPLYIDASGYLRAQRDYDQPVGPGFWERS
ncbi:MAG: Rieske (2Fe-2S) protein [Acidobacteriota bacterium]|nr:Rieske (2Fe-2S) protein [Acidobacteriota bacterium]MDE3043244.1 Rieske (2Fe-2S) protein [Acidobacteriota bacterium]MDE3106566.1 Rieske (2Fe-2S) protein [Acidobacteriota bacterium]MDE3222197.1 Rieske (2Fe-2S) protein [Acidobacteriota bacterium]